MNSRYARHTDKLDALIKFYTEIIGLEILGEFNSHDNYDGVFLGKPNETWHLEFTSSNEPANHTFDEDDLIVFYINTIAEKEVVLNMAKASKAKIIKAKNPYWNRNGLTLLDPDGFRVVITIRN